MMTLYSIMYKDWHTEYRLAKSNEDAERIGKMIYTKADVWYTMEM